MSYYSSVSVCLHKEDVHELLKFPILEQKIKKLDKDLIRELFLFDKFGIHDDAKYHEDYVIFSWPHIQWFFGEPATDYVLEFLKSKTKHRYYFGRAGEDPEDIEIYHRDSEILYPVVTFKEYEE